MQQFVCRFPKHLSTPPILLFYITKVYLFVDQNSENIILEYSFDQKNLIFYSGLVITIGQSMNINVICVRHIILSSLSVHLSHETVNGLLPILVTQLFPDSLGEA